MPANENLSIPYDPSSISPSAYALLLMKRHTAIPYAREAAALLDQHIARAKASASTPADSTHTDPAADPGAAPRTPIFPDLSSDPARFAALLLHFETRYWSIDQLLADLPLTNILELSSGFSFRGLDLTRRKPVHYIDTDLLGLIAVKRPMIDALLAGSLKNGSPPGHYELQPLDVLDSDAFTATIARFLPGPLAIVNEGLLVYLDTPQKERLCANIRKALSARGGCWITADIYIRDPSGEPAAYSQWRTQHQIEEKKFRDYDEAHAFFTRMGFKIDKEATPDDLRQPGRNRLRATWRLTLQP